MPDVNCGHVIDLAAEEAFLVALTQALGELDPDESLQQYLEEDADHVG